MGSRTIRHYLIGRKFKVITDHANLKLLASIAPQNSKLARWCLSLAEFDFVIQHRPGKGNVVPDALSRAPLPSPHPEDNTLVIPPSEVSPFLLTALCFDLCLNITNTESQLSSFPLTCVSLALVCGATSTGEKNLKGKEIWVCATQQIMLFSDVNKFTESR